ncbi:MAG: hypothetical protein ACHREM_09810 [Polyangiales bacterium]
MKRVCAWCRTDLGTVDGDFDPRLPITHTICPECDHDFDDERTDETVQAFLDRLDVPVLLVDHYVRVIAASRQAQLLLADGVRETRGQTGGSLLECVSAALPGGCGGSVHCKGCSVRNSVLETHETGRPLNDVPAYVNVDNGAQTGRRWLRLSTQKVGDRVLLRIDPASTSE